jgi:pyrroline-5-carboxylate reductase
MTPILLLGAGRMGGALITGWRASGAFPAGQLIIRDPHPGPEAKAAAADGARLNPSDDVLAQARTVILAVKPQTWRDVAADVSARLAPEAMVVSIAAGVASADISRAFAGRTVARVMPTTAVAIRQGAASIFAADPAARELADALFRPLGAVVHLADEDLMHVATAVSGSAPAYLYAFVEALEAGGVASGLTPEASAELVRATLAGAAALMAQSGEAPAELRRQVTSPGGTTQAALDVLMSENGFGPLLRHAVAAAVKRSRELG